LRRADAFGYGEAMEVRAFVLVLVLGVIAGTAAHAAATTYQVKPDFAPIFFLQDGKVTGSEFVERGTRFAVERIENNLGYGTWQGKPAYIRLAHLEPVPAVPVAVSPPTPVPTTQPSRPSVPPTPPEPSPEEKHRQEQLAKGLVEHEGRWVTKEEKANLEKGLVFRDGQWVDPQAAARLRELSVLLADGPPIHLAAKSGDVGRISALLKANPHAVNSVGAGGNTPLHYAAFGGHRDAAQLLLANGALVNALNESRQTPLHLAVMAGRREVVGLLLARGANVNAADREGRTPLALAAGQESLREVIEPFARSGRGR
jgi:hypothetical protein